jgi:glycerol uptake facilitator-like aquaporin
MIDLDEVEEDFKDVFPVRSLIVFEENIEHVENSALEFILEFLKTILFLFFILAIAVASSSTRTGTTGSLFLFFHKTSSFFK